MATGLLIRDFFKQTRESRYSDRGSLSVSGIEHNAYRLSLTLEITHIDGPRYGNLKTLPENTHYGYLTLFRGSTVTDTIAVKYPKFRVFDIINQGIWNYHQHSESLQLLAGGFQSLINEQSSYFVATPGFVTFDTCRTLRFLFPPGADPVADLVLRLAGCEDPFAGDGERDLSDGYRGFPVATPFPDIVKFKGDIPLSFVWRLEQWYLVNPAVYITDNPTDTSDATEGEDEYPVPDQGDGDGDGSEFPAADEPPEGSDSRDFVQDSDNLDPSRPVQVRVTWAAISAGCVNASGTVDRIFAYEPGNWRLEYGQPNDGPGTGCPQNNGFSNLFVVSPSGARQLVIGGVMRDGSKIDFVRSVAF